VKEAAFRCFVSYCHEDIDRESFGYLINTLQENCGESIEIPVDLSDIRYGRNIDDFIDQVEIASAIIVVLTPKYKERVKERKGGVYKEYERILVRYEQELRKGNVSRSFVLIPILFSGDGNTSVPSELERLRFADLHGLRVYRSRTTNKPMVPRSVKTKYVPIVKEIASQLKALETLASRAYDEDYRNYYRRFFVETKERGIDPSLVEHLGDILIKTLYYRKVANQEVFFLIGRKGSGKTLTSLALALEPKGTYVSHIAVNANDFSLQPLYALIQNLQLQSDLKNVFTRHRMFEFAWEAFIISCCIDALYQQATDKRWDDQQRRLIDELRNFVQDVVGNQISRQLENVQFALFVYCFNQIQLFIEDVIQKARADPKYFYSDIQLLSSLNAYLEFVFGAKRLDILHELLNSLKDRKFLMTFDGIDWAFDKFRKESIFQKSDLQERSLFEKDWLGALLRSVLDIKKSVNHPYDLGNAIDFCITIPEDRFIEVTRAERDSIEYRPVLCHMNWSGIELADLLRKRLELMTETKAEKARTPELRLTALMKNQLRYIPEVISVTINDRTYAMPLFCYVLRHTLWRPREILTYYAKILAACEFMKKKKAQVTSRFLSQVVNSQTTSLVEDEFIGEFSSTIVNIDEIVRAFTRKKQIITYDEIEEALRGIEFKWATGVEGHEDTCTKIRILYRLGFLGVYADEKMCTALNIHHKHAFVFNEGDDFVRSTDTIGFRYWEYIIHPLFTQYLNLDRSEMILPLTWEYLHENAALRYA
jgi:hypothetical protein